MIGRRLMNIKLVSPLLSGPLVLLLLVCAHAQAIQNRVLDVARPLPLADVRLTHRFDHQAFLDPLERREDKLEGQHGKVGAGSIERSPPGSATGRFYEADYKIPAELVKDQKKLTVKFQAAGGNETATIFGVRLVRADET